jgi:hypothetical protein
VCRFDRLSAARRSKTGTPDRRIPAGEVIRQRSIVDAALAAARRRWAVFPLRRRDKRPAVADWEHAATDDVDRIRSWWERHPDHNIGLATEPSRLLVADLDVKDADGVSRFVLDVIPAPRELPDTYTVGTPSGGLHLYFEMAANDDWRNTAGRLGVGIDTRGHGGYVVGAGSITPTGSYRCVNDSPVTMVPTWLVRRLEVRYSTPPRPDPATERLTANLGRSRGPRGTSGLARTVAAMAEGSRNSALNWAAHRLGQDVAAGRVHRSDVELALTELCTAALDAGLTAAEVRATIDSGILSGLGPRRRPRPGDSPGHGARSDGSADHASSRETS